MARIIGPAAAGIPWQERPAGNTEPVWRYTNNPIIERDAVPRANSIFNSAVVPFRDGYAGVFRVDDTSRLQTLHRGFSKDGIHWELDKDQIAFISDDPEVGHFVYGYDPRVCFMDGRYYVTWCNGYHGPTIGMAYTEDFEKFYQMENLVLPYNRNGVLFPRKINGRYYLLSRPSDKGHTPFGDIFISESPDLCYWGKHRHVRAPLPGWGGTKIGPGPVPIETDEGWLMIFHGVLYSCNGFVYSMGVALLDIDQPWKVKYRARPYILNPRTYYECVGDVPNVVFPCATLADAASGRIAIYYGCADTSVGLAFTTIDDLVDFARENHIPE